MMLPDAAYRILQLICRRNYLQKITRQNDISCDQWQTRELASLEWTIDQFSKFGFAEDVALAEHAAQQLGGQSRGARRETWSQR